MGRFFALTIFLVVVAGMALHQGVELFEYADWIGRLPGDLIVKKKGVVLYLPFASALLISGGLSFLFSLFSRKT
ncbi:MAG: DUF2905 domain-containing protein [Chlamydiales bacterium]|nr:DUF2905 domain-containing protein [Chlamydiales bacterium]